MRSPDCATVSPSWNPAWSGYPNGGPTPPTTFRRTRPSTGPWSASAATTARPQLDAPGALQQADRGVHGGGDVVVGGVEQGPPGDQALDGRQPERLAPARERGLRVVAHLAAEQQGRQRGRGHDPL